MVVGRWEASPFGEFADVMLERPDGHRILYAPTGAVGDFIAETYLFDEVRTVPVTAEVRGAGWTVEADDRTSSSPPADGCPSAGCCGPCPGRWPRAPRGPGSSTPSPARACRG